MISFLFSTTHIPSGLLRILMNQKIQQRYAVADPGFPRWGGSPNPIFWPFALKLHKIENILDQERGGRASVAYHEIEDGRFYQILVYNDNTGSMRKDFFTQQIILT